MKELRTEIRIQAPVKTVWHTLMDFAQYPQWNPFIISIAGETQVTHTLQTSIQPPKGKVMNFQPKVLVVKPYQEFRWRGKLFIKGLFEGEHYFILQSISETETQFIQGEKFTGILVPLFESVFAQTEKGFAMMNEALKARCEAML